MLIELSYKNPYKAIVDNATDTENKLSDTEILPTPIVILFPAVFPAVVMTSKNVSSDK